MQDIFVATDNLKASFVARFPSSFEQEMFSKVKIQRFKLFFLFAPRKKEFDLECEELQFFYYRLKRQIFESTNQFILSQPAPKPSCVEREKSTKFWFKNHLIAYYIFQHIPLEKLSLWVGGGVLLSSFPVLRFKPGTALGKK